MDKEINKNIENLVDSVDYLIEFFEREKREKSVDSGFSSLDDVSQNIKGFEKYLKTIQENTSQLKDIKQSLNAHFQNIDNLQPKIEEPEEKPLNQDIDQKHFVEIQNEIKQLVSQIGDLTNTLNQAGIKLDIDINPQNLEQIKQQLEELKLSPQINFDSVLEQLDEVKKNFDSLQNLEIKDVDFKVLNADKLDSLLEKIGEFKNVSIEFNQDDINSLTKLEETLQSLKEIDFKNLESLKELDNLKSLEGLDIKVPDMSGLEALKNIDFDTVIEKINSLNNIDVKNLVLDIDVKEDINKKVDSISTKISELKDNLANINFTSDLTVNVNTDTVKESIREDLKNVDVNIKPTLDLSELDALKNKEYTVKLKTEIVESNVSMKEVPLKTIQNEKPVETNNNKEILEQLAINNEVLKAIATMMASSKGTVENNVTNITSSNGGGSVTEIKPVEEAYDPNTALLEAMSALLDKTSAIHLELLKNSMKGDI